MQQGRATLIIECSGYCSHTNLRNPILNSLLLMPLDSSESRTCHKFIQVSYPPLKKFRVLNQCSIFTGLLFLQAMAFSAQNSRAEHSKQKANNCSEILEIWISWPSQISSFETGDIASKSFHKRPERSASST
jgi:hypothetical protein